MNFTTALYSDPENAMFTLQDLGILPRNFEPIPRPARWRRPTLDPLTLSAAFPAKKDLWFSISEAKKVRASVFLGLTASVLTQSTYVGITTTIASAIWNSIKNLSVEELEVFQIMQRLSGGKVYDTWIPEDQLLGAIPEDAGENHIKDVLAGMVK